MDHDLLDTPLLSYRDPQRHRGKTTLPGLLARLGACELGDFPRVRAHQLHPWCMFLTQLAAIALHGAGRADPSLREETWRDLLLSLTAGKHEPWCLVVEDLAQPAFFQPPVPEGAVDGWNTHESPDDIDVLVTAKAHDVKTALIPGDDIEAWVYALTTLQTTQGIYGHGKYGVARMNGGYGSRPRVGYSPDNTLSARFLRDVDVLLTSWPNLVARGYRNDGLALVWTAGWDGSAALPLHELAPHFIEICRRVRFVRLVSRLVCYQTTSRERRCLPEIDRGNIGDPWIPIKRENDAALSVGPRGFHYRLLAQLLFENEFEPPASQQLRDHDPDPILFVAAALARGQGGTDGLHERVLALAGRVRWQLGKPDTRAVLGIRATQRVNTAQIMGTKVLYPALERLASAGDERTDRRRVTSKMPSRVTDDFYASVDEVFFHHLFVTLGEEDERARLGWERALRTIASEELERGIRRYSAPSARRFKAISSAETMFLGCLRKNFPDIHTAAAQQAAEGGPS